MLAYVVYGDDWTLERAVAGVFGRRFFKYIIERKAPDIRLAADIAYAMGNIPLIGKLFQAVTFRDYQYESEKFDANVEVPQIIVEDTRETSEESEDDSKQLQETIDQGQVLRYNSLGV